MICHGRQRSNLDLDKNDTILVTGAGGFIGGRTVEVLHCLGAGNIRAGVRTWAHAARVGRLPVEIVPCDVLDKKQVERVMHGVRAVVHCARGTPDVTLEGTQNLLDSAHKHKIDRFIFLSSVAVYGDENGDLDESSRRQPGSGEYADSKIEAEDQCLSYAAKGLGVTVLRPTCVYGPFGESWTTRIAQRVQTGHLRLSSTTGSGRCNLVYVDDLVGAIRLALVREESVGETFNINGSDSSLLWNDYLNALAAEMGLSAKRVKGAVGQKTSSFLIGPARSTANLIAKYLRTPLESIGRRHAIIGNLMEQTANLIYDSPDGAEMRLFQRDAYYSADKAQRILGYQPAFSMHRGVALSVAWMRHHDLIQVPRTST